MDDDALRSMLPMSFGGGGGGGAKKPQPGPREPHTKTGRETEEEEEEEEEANEVFVGPPVPADNGDENGENDFCGPVLPPGYEDIGAGTDDQPTTATFSSSEHRVPCSSEAALEQHTKAVTALDIDPQGARMLTGSSDYTVKLFDFAGMKADCKAFKTIEPSEGHPVLALSWSPTGDAFMAVTSSAQPKIYSRDGVQEGEFPRGDMYIRDLKNTTGHITSCTDGCWHPTERGSGVTSSADGTVRVWDMWSATQNTVIKPSLKKPGRTSVTAVRYNKDGTLIAGGLEDGTIQIWDVRGKHQNKANVGMVAASTFQSIKKQNWTVLSKSNRIARNAHAPSTDITCLRFGTQRSHALLSRNETDGSLKLWDLRKFTAPVATVQDLPTGFVSIGNTQCCFSPNEDLVLCGVGATQSADGHIAVYDADTLRLVKRLGCRNAGSVIAVTWHPKLNQIAYGCGDRKQGGARMLYDVDVSARHLGIVPAVGRRPRPASDADEFLNVQHEIYDPSTVRIVNGRRVVPNERDGAKRGRHFEGTAATTTTTSAAAATTTSAARKMAKLFKPKTSAEIEAQRGAASNYGAGGRIGVGTHSSILTQYLLKNQGVLKPPEQEDVRESILRHAGEGEAALKDLTAAYRTTQPKAIFQDAADGNDDDGEEGGDDNKDE